MNLPKNEYRISITSGCNMKCVYCHNEGNRECFILSKDSIEELIKNSYNLGLTGVRLTGGEPTIHPEFIEICKILKEKYGLKVGVNTNAIEIEKLQKCIEKGYIDRVIVGIDYIDNYVSKKSPIGKSSKEILDSIILLKSLGVDVSVATVFTEDLNNTEKIFNFCKENKIIVKIIEKVDNEIYDTTSETFCNMRKYLINKYKLKTIIDDFNQVIGKNDKNEIVVKFFHSHCRIRECDICKNIHLRVTAKGELKECLHYSDKDIVFNNGNIRDNVLEVLTRKVDYHDEEKKLRRVRSE